MKVNEGLCNFIDRMLLSLEFLLAHLEHWQKDYKKDDWFKKHIDTAH